MVVLMIFIDHLHSGNILTWGLSVIVIGVSVQMDGTQMYGTDQMFHILCTGVLGTFFYGRALGPEGKFLSRNIDFYNSIDFHNSNFELKSRNFEL